MPKAKTPSPRSLKSKKIRYGVLGLGHIAQVAMIPAFKHARKNSELTALISQDPLKLKALAKKYKIKNTFKESDFDEALASGCMDALYIATPNTDHVEYIEKALAAGIHVLTEKPLAAELNEALAVKAAMEKYPETKLMVAYRLHFDPANLGAIQEAHKKSFGKLKCFSSTFSYQIKDRKNIRLKSKKGGGPLLDIGIYCINAARYLFRAEPTEVHAIASTFGKDPRFTEVDEMVAVTLKFPEGQIAQFTCSFGMYDSAQYTLIGDKGRLELQNAYEYTTDMQLKVKTENKEKTKNFKKHDQFAPELIYFSDCILRNKMPEPSVKEGILDLKIIEAIEKSIETGQKVFIDNDANKQEYPSPSMKMRKPGIKRPPQTVRVTPAHGS